MDLLESSRRPLNEAIDAVKAVTQRRAAAVRAAVTNEDSSEEHTCADALSLEIDQVLETLGWSRATLIAAVAKSHAVKALESTSSVTN